MTNEEAKACLKYRIKRNDEIVADIIEHLANEAMLFTENISEAKEDTVRILDEINGLLCTLRRHSDDIDACLMQTGAYKVALGLLED